MPSPGAGCSSGRGARPGRRGATAPAVMPSPRRRRTATTRTRAAPSTSPTGLQSLGATSSPPIRRRAQRAPPTSCTISSWSASAATRATQALDVRRRQSERQRSGIEGQVPSGRRPRTTHLPLGNEQAIDQRRSKVRSVPSGPRALIRRGAIGTERSTSADQEWSDGYPAVRRPRIADHVMGSERSPDRGGPNAQGRTSGRPTPDYPSLDRSSAIVPPRMTQPATGSS